MFFKFILLVVFSPQQSSSKLTLPVWLNENVFIYCSFVQGKALEQTDKQGKESRKA